ncbi:MAG: ATP-dependent helicase HrpB [Deltaproteobacteria bacterium]|nr:ATP-dependent helicase HrpB [Deltaproteobacteria bacterium]
MTFAPIKFGSPLPIDDALPNLLRMLRQNQCVILSAPPGSGKTTRVPLALLNEGVSNNGLIVMLEPRRVAARSVASYMAETLNESIGQTVGYQVRMERRMGTETRVLVVTEGILTRRFLSDPLLEDVACVIIDEFHERAVHVDLALCLLKEALTVRTDLKVIVMSATIDAAEASAYLSDCPIVNVEGTPFPLSTIYAPERMDLLSSHRSEAVASAAVLNALTTHPNGDILVFLPGAGEIERTRVRLQSRVPVDVEIVPLYGALPAEQQDYAVKTGTRRRVILATNIAETSLTIPNVKIVIDTGLEKRMEWRSGIGFEKLVTGRISHFSAVQRAGRAARTAPGTVYRLWHASQEREMTQSTLPEILRVDPLSTVFVLVASFCKPPTEIELLTPLRPNSIEEAMTTLQLLGLVSDGGNRMTELGKLALQLPIHPRLALIIIAAALTGQASRGAAAAAIIEERPMLGAVSTGTEPGSENCDCDISLRVDLLDKFISLRASAEAARKLELNYMVYRRVVERKNQFERIIATLPLNNVKLESPAFLSSAYPTGELAPLLLYGFWDRVCKKDTQHATTGVMATGRGVTLGPDTGVRASRYFLAIDAISDSRRSKQRSEITLASGCTAEMLEQMGRRFFSTHTELEMDDAGKVVAFERIRYMKLPWREKRLSRIPQTLRSKMLATRACADWKGILFSSDDQKNALCRLALARHLFLDLEIPAIDGNGLSPYIEAECKTASDLSQLKNVNWAKQIVSSMPYEQHQRLCRQFPLSIELPSGRRANIDYTRWYQEKTSPIIRVKLQELFGLQTTPYLADGRIGLSIALLAPNGHEVQITNDLKNFWEITYPQVRKELRARYAKHFWPEDPLTAVPTHLTQKQYKRQNRT